ncbi:hypothetical protein P167DRAFT_1833 [Morchella conica CCBAS932]|uniref:Uncharacterized protein n=1 Tax=Morchella conica CCBAS932 TaxID=1392247 RepID=A0A3N4L3P6_9PEZI|nr:hypothetical protein P167DRAFT_1833 [Morchella conica CCBAS932]
MLGYFTSRSSPRKSRQRNLLLQSAVNPHRRFLMFQCQVKHVQPQDTVQCRTMLCDSTRFVQTTDHKIARSFV